MKTQWRFQSLAFGFYAQTQRTSIHSFVRPSVRPFVRSFIHSLTHSLITIRPGVTLSLVITDQWVQAPVINRLIALMSQTPSVFSVHTDALHWKQAGNRFKVLEGCFYAAWSTLWCLHERLLQSAYIARSFWGRVHFQLGGTVGEFYRTYRHLLDHPDPDLFVQLCPHVVYQSFAEHQTLVLQCRGRI